MKFRVLLDAFGAALVLLLPYFCPLLYPGHRMVFHHQFPITNIICGVLLDLVVLTVAGAALFWVLRCFWSSPRRLVVVLLASMIVWQGIRLCCIFFAGALSRQPAQSQFAPSHSSAIDVLGMWGDHPRLTFAGLALLFSLLAWIFPDIFHRLVRVLRFGLRAVAFSGLWIVPQLLWFAFYLHPVLAFDHSVDAALPQPDRRIIWVLFDELSQKLTFDASSPVRMPNFNALQAQSVSLTDVQPFDHLTERIIPSILSHHAIGAIASSTNGSLLTKEEQRAGWIAYEPSRTLLGEAMADGWNPALTGWFIPYCRVFEGVLTACSWTPSTFGMIPIEKLGASQKKSILVNALVIPTTWSKDIFARGSTAAKLESQQHRAVYLSVMSDAHRLIQNQNIGFIFVHLPVPHPPGIYSRYTHRFQTGGNYFDNLVLADDALGELLAEIQRSPAADRTTLIVSSDHSWRVPDWRKTPNWSPEEERISQGNFDPTPVFLVHFPGQSQGIDIVEQIPEMTEYDIVLSLLRRRLNSPQDLEQLLSPANPQIDISQGQ